MLVTNKELGEQPCSHILKSFCMDPTYKSSDGTNFISKWKKDQKF